MALFAAGCKTSPDADEVTPHENLLSVATDFSLLASRDPYRDPPGKDLTGSSIAQATLARLNNYQSLHPNRFSPEIEMIRARALEFLGALEQASEAYEDATAYDSKLREEAIRRLDYLEELLVADALSPEEEDLVSLLSTLDEKAKEFYTLSNDFEDPFYVALALREGENSEVRRTELMAANRQVLPNGEAEAEEALESLVRTHEESHRSAGHVLRLARFHRQIAEEEVRLHPPGQAGFSADRFRRHYEEATDLLYRLTQADGRPERLIARHELNAVLELGEYVSGRAR